MLHLQEKSLHGSLLLPLHVYNHFDPHGHYSVNSHWHHQFEIIYLVYGEMLAHVDGEKIHLQAGDCLCLHPGELHSLTGIQNVASQHFALVFAPQFLASATIDAIQVNYLEPLKKGGLRLPRHLPKQHVQPASVTAIEAIATNYRSEQFGAPLLLKAAFYQLLAQLLSEPAPFLAPQLNSPQHIDYVKTVISYIQSHYHTKLYLQDLADLCHTNPHHLGKIFKKITGQTPFDYITHYRIEQATTRLLTTNDAITTIAFDVGFDNVSYFIRTFKKKWGTTPSQYRKSQFPQ
ncbi:MAG: AraC family transcriptional regulator [Culicoidibacterales bacterium]